jgi:hypothetical protein
MIVYIVTFKGAYGLQIAEVFTSEPKARQYIEKQKQDAPFYNYEIQPFVAI